MTVKLNIKTKGHANEALSSETV